MFYNNVQFLGMFYQFINKKQYFTSLHSEKGLFIDFSFGFVSADS